MDILQAITARRSIKQFGSGPVTRKQLESLLDHAVLAPNHRMTEPWRFIVMGPEARRAYGEVLGGRRARKVDDPDAARKVLEKTVADTVSIPATVAVVQQLDDDEEIREEDYAAIFMGVQNMLLGALSMGLGTHIKTGAVMDDPGVRDALKVGAGERIVALVQIGTPAEIPSQKGRTPAREHTRWLP